jgi:hypothetical protein
MVRFVSAISTIWVESLTKRISRTANPHKSCLLAFESCSPHLILHFQRGEQYDLHDHRVDSIMVFAVLVGYRRLFHIEILPTDTLESLTEKTRLELNLPTASGVELHCVPCDDGDWVCRVEQDPIALAFGAQAAIDRHITADTKLTASDDLCARFLHTSEDDTALLVVSSEQPLDDSTSISCVFSDNVAQLQVVVSEPPLTEIPSNDHAVQPQATELRSPQR